MKDKAVSLRILQFETWKVKNENEEEIKERIKEIEILKKGIENNLINYFKEGNKLKIIESKNDLKFLSKRIEFINKSKNL